MRDLKVIFSVFFIASIFFAILISKFFTRCDCERPRKPKYILYDKFGPNSQILVTVEKVLNRLHMEKIEVQSLGLEPEDVPLDWDLFWSFHFHEKHQLQYENLKYYQKVNHWPGNYALVAKSFLTSKTDSKYIPKGFEKVEEVREYAAKNPGKKFVIKSTTNRGVRLMDPKEMNFDNKKIFAQEFIHPPLLWNGHKFDFSIFVVITSVNPLRLYRYEKNVNLRFCKKPYSIDDPDDVDSYVIGSDFWPSQDFERVKSFNEKFYTNKEAFEDFMASRGADLSEIWWKVDDLIRSVVMSKERFIIEGLSRFGTSKYNHFELFRFDMLFDENFNLFLLECNMSPNLMAPPKKSLNKFMFENLLFNLFNLIGIATSYDKENFKFKTGDYELMAAHPNGMTILPQMCVNECENCDYSEECLLCWHCMDDNSKFDIMTAYNEQRNIGDFKRLFPPSNEEIDYEDLSYQNARHVRWYEEMCKKNKKFC